MAEERSLPGWPKKKLVKEVRRHLSHYGILCYIPSDGEDQYDEDRSSV